LLVLTESLQPDGPDVLSILRWPPDALSESKHRLLTLGVSNNSWKPNSSTFPATTASMFGAVSERPIPKLEYSQMTTVALRDGTAVDVWEARWHLVSLCIKHQLLMDKTGPGGLSPWLMGSSRVPSTLECHSMGALAVIRQTILFSFTTVQSALLCGGSCRLVVCRRWRG
jgi:hypothetical protein